MNNFSHTQHLTIALRYSMCDLKHELHHKECYGRSSRRSRPVRITFIHISHRNYLRSKWSLSKVPDFSGQDQGVDN